MITAEETGRCPNCGREVDPLWSFCMGCGSTLKAPEKPVKKETPKRFGLTMTVNEVCEMFRSYGIRMEARRLSDGIASGVYPFGRVVRVSGSGRRTFEIWRIDVENFLKSRIPEEERV